jgi:hypothetical protein
VSPMTPWVWAGVTGSTATSGALAVVAVVAIALHDVPPSDRPAVLQGLADIVRSLRGGRRRRRK